MNVELVSPENVLWSGEATQILARTLDGDIAFLPGHAPFIGALDIAVVRVWPTDGEPVAFAVHGGFVEVSDSSVSVLSDVAELANEIDVDRAKAAQERASAAVAADENDAAAAAANKRAHVRLVVAGATSDAH
ncbi:MAG: F0F1 ATP synthase subunit epsilon [Actinobacteria bacterium]|nr:F0F1 ATP synthase subunit epsilon [Actinomycetota bacterium]